MCTDEHKHITHTSRCEQDGRQQGSSVCRDAQRSEDAGRRGLLSETPRSARRYGMRYGTTYGHDTGRHTGTIRAHIRGATGDLQTAIQARPTLSATEWPESGECGQRRNNLSSSPLRGRARAVFEPDDFGALPIVADSVALAARDPAQMHARPCENAPSSTEKRAPERSKQGPEG